MKKIQLVVVIFLFCLLPKETMAQQEQCNIYIKGKLQDKVDQPLFTIAALEKSYLCTSPEYKEYGDLCSAKLPCEAKHAVLTVSAPGFKKHRRNLAQLKFNERRTLIEIGVVTLVPSSLPAEVKQIIRSLGPDQSVRFEIIIYNKLEQELLVQQLTFEARRDGKDVSCKEGGIATFQVANQLLITAKQGELLNASGEFRELLRSPDFAVQAEGAISYKTCGGRATLSLEMPTAFTIPSKEYSAIEVRLPSRFDVTFMTGSMRPDSSFLASIAGVVADVLSYDDYVFHLQTFGEEELDLVGTYSGKTRSFQRR